MDLNKAARLKKLPVIVSIPPILFFSLLLFLNNVSKIECKTKIQKMGWYT